jgi:phosphatidylinositol kinase/protein kinase (PI-3  family)
VGVGVGVWVWVWVWVCVCFSLRSTVDDWVDWMRGFSIELLKQSPSPALRACSALAQKYPPLAREMFNAAFVRLSVVFRFC